MVLAIWVLISFAVTFVWVVCRRFAAAHHTDSFPAAPLERNPYDRVNH